MSNGLQRPFADMSGADVLSAPSADGRVSRILLVAEAFGGGVFEVIRLLADGLVASGYAVAVAYGRRFETPENVAELFDPSVELLPMRWKSRSIAAQLGAQRQLRRTVARWRPDLVHAVSSFAGLHGTLAARGVPTVYTPQGYSFTMSSEHPLRRWIYFIVETAVASRVSVIGACSLSEGEQARSLPAGVDIMVVPNGIAELNASDAADAMPADEKLNRVVAMGRPLPQRQPEACARILRSVGPGHSVAWLGGGDGDVDGVRALVDAGVRMTGWMPRSQILGELGRSTVYLHWTAWDGLPLSVLEAMALDTVVVASDIGPNREILGSAQVCKTEAEAVELISVLLEDRDAREHLLANQRQRRKEYGADSMIRSWDRVYASLLSPRSPGLIH